MKGSCDPNGTDSIQAIRILDDVKLSGLKSDLTEIGFIRYIFNDGYYMIDEFGLNSH